MGTSLYEMLDIALSLPIKQVLILDIYYFSEAYQRQGRCGVFKINRNKKNENIFDFVRKCLPIEDYQNRNNFTLHAYKSSSRIWGDSEFNSVVVHHCLNTPMYTPIALIVDMEYFFEKGCIIN